LPLLERDPQQHQRAPDVGVIRNPEPHQLQRRFDIVNRYTKVIAASLLACTAQATLAAGSRGMERHVQGFLDALAAGGGKPLEQLSPADARAALVRGSNPFGRTFY
jgi:hypothetical protein